MASTKCPICDNPGIPDYHLQNVICPHCGSDLSIYKKINDAARLDNPKTSDHYFNAKKILIATLAFICIAAVASFISYNVSRKPLLEQIEKMNTEINSLNESLAQAKSKAQTKPETAVFPILLPVPIIFKEGFLTISNWVTGSNLKSGPS